MALGATTNVIAHDLLLAALKLPARQPLQQSAFGMRR